jgi:hypothetical protein
MQAALAQEGMHLPEAELAASSCARRIRREATQSSR